MSKISTWSTTADDNNAAVPNGWAESMLPSGVNNTAREGMAQTRVVWNDKEWFEVGDGSGTTVVTRTGNTTVTIPTDVRASHHVGRFVKIIGSNSGTIFTHISASSYSSPNTTITFASELYLHLTQLYLYILALLMLIQVYQLLMKITWQVIQQFCLHLNNL